MYVHGERRQYQLPSHNLPLLTCKLPSPLQTTPPVLYSTADAVVGAGEGRQWWSVKAPLMELSPRGNGGGIGNGDGMDASPWKVHMHSCGSPCPGNRDEPWLPQLLPYLTKAHLPLAPPMELSDLVAMWGRERMGDSARLRGMIAYNIYRTCSWWFMLIGLCRTKLGLC